MVIELETSELEEKIFSALKNDKKILELLPSGESSIFHLQAPTTDPEFPILVYSPISDVPILHGDNFEKLHRVTIRIHIIAGEKDYSEIYSEVKRVMTELEFTRIQATPFIEDGKKIMVADFKKIIGG